MNAEDFNEEVWKVIHLARKDGVSDDDIMTELEAILLAIDEERQ